MWKQYDSDDPIENDHLNLQLSSVLWSLILSFSSLFSCPVTLLFWFILTALAGSFSAQAVQKALKTHCGQPTQHQLAISW